MKNLTIAVMVLALILLSAYSMIYLPGNRGVVFITGLAGSGSSSTSFNITEETSVSVSGSVDFGEGRVYANASEAVLYSELGYFYQYDLINLTSSNLPEERIGSFVYYEAMDVFILYGFSFFPASAPSYKYETWQYNYSSNSWTNLTNAGNPNAYRHARMVYDASAQAIILFGGSNGSNNFNETWKFNSSRQWEKLSPAVSPPPPGIFAMEFDSSRNITVAVGINIGTWEYNSSANTWTNVTTLPYPAAVDNSEMVFDSKRNVMVLVGPEPSGYTNETWEYDGAGWTNVTASISGAPKLGRRQHSMVYDPVIEKTVLIGGYTTAIPFGSNRTFEYNGTAWTSVENLPYRMHPCAAFNSKINKTIMTHGYYILSSDLIGLYETYEYNVSEIDFNESACINGSWYFQRGWFDIENDGTVNISINYTADRNAAQFIGGESPSFRIKGVAYDPEACPGLDTDYSEVPNSTETPNNICPLLRFSNGVDVFRAPVRIVVPAEASAGSKNATITFTATRV